MIISLDCKHTHVSWTIEFICRYSQGVKLAGVVYMHCITEDHMRGASRRNFQIFSKFCGDTSLRDVLIVTNTRAADGPNDGKAHKEESIHTDEFFGPAVDKGVRLVRHNGSQTSALAILRHFLVPKHTVPFSRDDTLGQKTNPNPTSAAAVREITGQVEHHTKAFRELCQGIDIATLAEDETTKKILQENAKDSLEEIERIRYDLEKMVTDFATENSRLAVENRRYKNDFTTQRAETELGMRLLEEECRAREHAEASREQVEAQLAEERALWKRQRMERVNLREHAGPRYDKLFACGALIFVLLCVSRYAFNGSASLL